MDYFKERLIILTPLQIRLGKVEFQKITNRIMKF